MKVLILANDDGGLYRFRRELIQEFINCHSVYISVPDTGFTDDIRAIGCRVLVNKRLERRGTNPFADLKLLQYYETILKRLKPDIVFTYTIKPNVYGGIVCGKNQVPYVANITGLGTSIENGGSLQKLTLLLYRAGLGKAQKVFFQNKMNRDFMVSRHVVSGRHDILPGSGVNLEQYKVLDYPEGETIDFLFVARVMKEKGIDQYLDAAKAIGQRHPETRFHVCGICEEDYEEILREYEKEKIIIYHGMVKDMSEMYRLCSCTVHPTYYPEGLSNVLLESAASGRPVITTNRPGCREVIDDGINGYLVKKKDSGDLIRVLERFIGLNTEERRRMGLAGRKKVEREFDRRIVVRKYIEELNEVERKSEQGDGIDGL